MMFLKIFLVVLTYFLGIILQNNYINMKKLKIIGPTLLVLDVNKKYILVVFFNIVSYKIIIV